MTAAVAPDGVVTLPAPLRGRRFRLDVLAAAGSARPAVGIAEIRGPALPRVRARVSGSVVGRCGQSRAVIGGHVVAMRLGGRVAALDAGEPLTVTACGVPVALGAGPVNLQVAATVVRPLLIALRSPAPAPLAHAAGTTAGTVLNSGSQGNGSYTGVRVRVSTPSWLVLGESYNRGWQATCNGHTLGAPRVIDAFANGWRVSPGCTEVAITFGPQSEVDAGYVIGGLACLLALGIVLFTRPRAMGSLAGGGPDELTVREGFPRLRPAAAVAAGVACAAVFGFMFALRVGAVIGPGAALVLWRGLPARRAIQAAGLLLVIVIPAVYLIAPGHNQGGYDLGYVSQHLGAHWIAVGAFALLVFALARDLSSAAAAPSAGSRPPERMRAPLRQRLKRRIGRSTR
jgi:hypothetical protein